MAAQTTRHPNPTATDYWVQYHFDDTDRVCTRVSWFNRTDTWSNGTPPRNVLVIVRAAGDNGAELLRATLAPGESGQRNLNPQQRFTVTWGETESADEPSVNFSPFPVPA